jgi:hypothetical protein
MAKRNLNGRKSSGTAGIAVIEDPAETEHEVEDVGHAEQEEVTAPRRNGRRKPRLLSSTQLAAWIRRLPCCKSSRSPKKCSSHFGYIELRESGD